MTLCKITIRSIIYREQRSLKPKLLKRESPSLCPLITLYDTLQLLTEFVSGNILT